MARPAAQLLDGRAWANAKGAVLTALSLPESPDELLDDHASVLDDAFREVGGRLTKDSRVEIVARDRSRIDTWRISGACDFGEVSTWAEIQGGDGSAVIHVEVQTHPGLELVRLQGVPYSHGGGDGSPASRHG